MRILFVNHTANISGAEHSLLTMVCGLADRIDPVIACPPGPLADRASALGLDVRLMTEIDTGLRRSPGVALRGLRQTVYAAGQLRRLVHTTGADLVHANSIRAALVGVGARSRGGPPVVAHVRDCLPPGLEARAVRHAVAHGAQAIVVNSDYTGRHFGPARRLRVIHSPIDLTRFDPAHLDRAAARARLGVTGSEPLLGVVGQISPWKGQDTAVQALALLRRRHPDAQLAIVGEAKFVAASTRFDNRSFEKDLRATAHRLGIADAVRFTGEQGDIPAVLRALDLALLPSWREPLGRSGLEALAMGTPLLSTSVGGLAELVQDGVSARLLPPGDPAAWAGAAADVLEDGALRRRMTRCGRAVAGRCSPERIATELHALYKEVLHDRRR